MEISRSGLEVEWRRLEVIAENLANANTVRTGTGSPYQIRHLVSGPRSDFATYLDPKSEPSADGRGDGLHGVMIYGIENEAAPPRRVHEPGNPQADKDGYVTYPALDQAAEMTLMVKTARIYEANIVAMNAARQMYSKALELGRQS